MKKILLNYIIFNYLKVILKVNFLFYLFGMILNLFEEIEFFKGIDVSFFIPVTLTAIYVPSIIIDILPFIIFVSSMWFLINMRDKRELLTYKVYGYSNIKIFLVLGIFSFLLGWVILSFFNPLSSTMSKYYEKTKSDYSKDIDHLITFNKNGLWIKEILNTNEQRIIFAKKADKDYLEDVTIFFFNKDFEIKEKIFSETAYIKNNNWSLKNVSVIKFDTELILKKFETFEINSIYTYQKISSLFKNTHTISFIDLITNYRSLLESGYNKEFLNENLNKMLTLPFFLLIMTALACILTMHRLKESKNIKFIIVGIMVCVFVFYFKDLSNALGQTNRIPLSLSVWIPILSIGIFSFIGILQINEK
jgi:lipopolysaccharide export system permease protein